jgi:release factor glutamine methyltransferase
MHKTWTLIELINWTKDYLETKGIEKSRLEAELLLADMLGMKRIDLYVSFQRAMSKQELELHKSRVLKRASGAPVQYITGKTSFMGYPIVVDQRVLIPRPETEVLVEEAARFARHTAATNALELGTGSGAISIALAKLAPSLKIVATDISNEALEVALENLRANGVEERIELVRGDLFDSIGARDSAHSFDLVVSNPPYIAHGDIARLPKEIRDFEPAPALDGGENGMDVIRRILAAAPEYLKPGGKLFLEIGSGQGKLVEEAIADLEGFAEAEIKQDLAGMDRVLIARPAEGGSVG